MMPLDSLTFETPLLPPNKTKYMRAIEAGMQIEEAIWLAAQRVGDIKSDAPDAALPFLIWEHGLEILLPWISDLRLLYDKGPKWQRIRGTPDSIFEALSWIGFHPAEIEEMSRTSWWDLFQMRFLEPIADPDRLNEIFALTRLSKAAHTDLVRVYTSCWDIRAWEMDQHRLDGGAYFDDWSGVWVRPDWPKLSFCHRSLERVDINLTPTFYSSTERHSGNRLTVSRGFIVDRHRNDNDEVLDPLFEVASGNALERNNYAGQSYDGPYREDAGYGEAPYGYRSTIFNTWDPRVGSYGDHPYGAQPYGVPSFQAWEALTIEENTPSPTPVVSFDSWTTMTRSSDTVIDIIGGLYPTTGYPSDAGYPAPSFEAHGWTYRQEVKLPGAAMGGSGSLTGRVSLGGRASITTAFAMSATAASKPKTTLTVSFSIMPALVSPSTVASSAVATVATGLVCLIASTMGGASAMGASAPIAVGASMSGTSATGATLTAKIGSTFSAVGAASLTDTPDELLAFPIAATAAFSASLVSVPKSTLSALGDTGGSLIGTSKVTLTGASGFAPTPRASSAVVMAGSGALLPSLALRFDTTFSGSSLLTPKTSFVSASVFAATGSFSPNFTPRLTSTFAILADTGGSLVTAIKSTFGATGAVTFADDTGELAGATLSATFDSSGKLIAPIRCSFSATVALPDTASNAASSIWSASALVVPNVTFATKSTLAATSALSGSVVIGLGYPQGPYPTGAYPG